MAEIPRRITSRALVALAGILVLGIAAFLSLRWSEPRSGPLAGPEPSPGPKKPAPKKDEPRRLRSWPIESLPELSFDEALTLLSSEIESYRKAAVDSKPVRSDRIEQVAARLGEMHAQNLRKIARAATYYESHSPEARERFARFRATYEGRWQTLQRSLADLREGDAEAGEAILTLLRDSGALKPPLPIPEAKDLPRRRLPAEPREPRLSQEEWQTPRKVGMTPRGGNDREREDGFIDRLFGVQAAHAQGAEDDLAETPEVKFTAENAPEIQKLLDDEGLRGSPAKITNWVRNHIEFVPIWGALQSSVTCLDTRKGTALDIASLTIALLRASGIRARYQAGTVRLPIEDAKNWLGNFESAIAASSLLQSGGIPAVLQVDSAGKPVALRFEHVWVKAFVDYVPYQGACHVEGDTWIDIDTSTKALQFFPLPDLTGSFPPGYPQSFLDEIASKGDFDPATGELTLREQLSDPAVPVSDVYAKLLAEAGDRTLLELFGGGRPLAWPGGQLGASPPFEILARGWERSEVRDSDRFKIEIRLARGPETLLEGTFEAPEGGASRYSLSFRPESDLDREIISGQLPPRVEDGIPEIVFVAGVRVVPQLRRDGAVVAEGSAVDMGRSLELRVDYEEPVLNTPPIRTTVAAGAPVAIGLDLVGVPGSRLKRISADLGAVLEKIEREDPSADLAVFQEVFLASVVEPWFSQVDRFADLTRALDCLTHRYPSAGFCSSAFNVEELFGLALAGSRPGISVDIPGDVVILISLDGDPGRMRDVNFLQGFFGSGFEGLAPMQAFYHPDDPAYWVDSQNALAAALRSGETLAVVDARNATQILPKLALAADEVAEIREAVDLGLTVIAHERPLVDGDGKCHAGYVILDPVTGNGVYRISGGLCGARPFTCVSDKNPNSPIKTMEMIASTWFTNYREKAVAHANREINNNSQKDIIERLPGILDEFTSNFREKNQEWHAAAETVPGATADFALALAKLEVFHEVLREQFGGETIPNLGFWVGFTTYSTTVKALQNEVKVLHGDVSPGIMQLEECFKNYKPTPP